jgi:hypothetical protein
MSFSKEAKKLARLKTESESNIKNFVPANIDSNVYLAPFVTMKQLVAKKDAMVQFSAKNTFDDNNLTYVPLIKEDL